MLSSGGSGSSAALVVTAAAGTAGACGLLPGAGSGRRRKPSCRARRRLTSQGGGRGNGGVSVAAFWGGRKEEKHDVVEGSGSTDAPTSRTAQSHATKGPLTWIPFLNGKAEKSAEDSSKSKPAKGNVGLQSPQSNAHLAGPGETSKTQEQDKSFWPHWFHPETGKPSAPPAPSSQNVDVTHEASSQQRDGLLTGLLDILDSKGVAAADDPTTALTSDDECHTSNSEARVSRKEGLLTGLLQILDRKPSATANDRDASLDVDDDLSDKVDSDEASLDRDGLLSGLLHLFEKTDVEGADTTVTVSSTVSAAAPDVVVTECVIQQPDAAAVKVGFITGLLNGIRDGGQVAADIAASAADVEELPVSTTDNQTAVEKGLWLLLPSDKPRDESTGRDGVKQVDTAKAGFISGLLNGNRNSQIIQDEVMNTDDGHSSSEPIDKDEETSSGRWFFLPVAKQAAEEGAHESTTNNISEVVTDLPRRSPSPGDDMTHIKPGLAVPRSQSKGVDILPLTGGCAVLWFLGNRDKQQECDQEVDEVTEADLEVERLTKRALQESDDDGQSAEPSTRSHSPGWLLSALSPLPLFEAKSRVSPTVEMEFASVLNKEDAAEGTTEESGGLPWPALLTMTWGIHAETVTALKAVAGSMQKSIAGMDPWGLAELTFGLNALARLHAQERCDAALELHARLHEDTLRMMLRDLELVDAAYYSADQPDPAAALAQDLARRGALSHGRVLKFHTQADLLRPAYYVAIDDQRRNIVLCVRGTSSVQDLLTDLASSAEEVRKNQNGDGAECEYAHLGMMEAARWLLRQEAQTLIDLMKENPRYSLRIIGHSLGAGAGALAAMLLRESEVVQAAGINTKKITCIAFAPPACVSRNLASKLSRYVTSVVNQYDIIPRVSIHTLERLRNEILLADWGEALQSEGQGSRMLQIPELVRATVQKLNPSWKQVSEWVDSEAGRSQVAAAVKNNITSSDAGGPGQVLAERFTQLVSSWGIQMGQDSENAEETCSQEDHVSEDWTTAKQGTERQLYPPGKLHHVFWRQGDNHLDDGRAVDGGFEAWQGKPGSQFERIVLSRTMFADHFTEGYRAAMQNVLLSFYR
eukprot:jgi/Chlat1/5661/Chrsp37S05467